MKFDNTKDFNIICEVDMTNVKILLEQRKILVDNIKELNGNMFKVIIAVIPCFISMILSYYKLIVPTKYASYIRFAAIEIILILAMTVSAFLFNANIYRDYISAIDRHLYTKYNISSLIYEGELSKIHITGTKGTFPLITTLISFSVAIPFLVVIIIVFINDLNFYIQSISNDKEVTIKIMILKVKTQGRLIALNKDKTSKVKTKFAKEVNKVYTKCS